MKNFSLLICILGISFAGYTQTGMGTPNPNPSTVLDIVASNKGILIPRIALSSSTDATTITKGNVDGLLVFNTRTAADITPGFYYWLNRKWNKLIITDEIAASLPAVTNILTGTNGNLVSVVNGVTSAAVPVLTTAVNGITRNTAGAVELGGTLAKATTITTDATRTLTLAGLVNSTSLDVDQIVVTNVGGTLKKTPLASFLNTRTTVSNALTGTNLTTTVNGVTGIAVNLSGLSGWGLAGNAGTATSFLGTTNNESLRFKANNAEIMTIATDKKVGIGNTVPAHPLDVVSGTNDPIIASFLPLNKSQGFTIGHASLNRVSTSANSDFKITPKGTGVVDLDGGVKIKTLDAGAATNQIVTVDATGNLKKTASNTVGKTYTGGTGIDVTGTVISANTANALAVGAANGNLTSTVNSVASVAIPIVNNANNGVTRAANGTVELGGALTKATTITTTPANLLTVAGLVTTTSLNTDNVIVANAGGVLKKTPTSSFLAGATTNVLTATNGNLKSTVNGVASADIAVVTTAANGVTRAANGTVELGGDLTKAITIDTKSNALNLLGLANSTDLTDEILVVNGARTIRKMPTSSLLNSAWGLAGNTGTATSFLGTTNNQPLRFTTNNVERMTLNGTNLGIGNTAPMGNLHIGSGSGIRKIVLYQAPAANNDHQFFGFGFTGTGSILRQHISGGMFGWYNGASDTTTSELMRLNAAGNLGIGIVPTQKLHVAGKAIITTMDAGVAADQIVTVDANGLLKKRPSADVGKIYTGGTGIDVTGTVISANTANTLAVGATNGNLTSTVNGVASVAIPIVNNANNGVTRAANGTVELGGALTKATTITTTATNLLTVAGLVTTTSLNTDNVIVANAGGVLKSTPTSSFLAGATTNVLTATNGNLKSTVNGVASADVAVVTTAANGVTRAANGTVELGGALTKATTITTTATNLLTVAGLVTTTSLNTDNVIVANAGGVLKKTPTSSFLAGATRNQLAVAANGNLTSIVNGITSNAVGMISSASNGVTKSNGNVTLGGTLTSTATLTVNNGARFHITNSADAGGLRIVDGLQATGKVLTSDSYGIATWKDLNLSSAWGLAGNTGAAASFLGTTNGQPLNFKTSNIQRMNIAANGKIGIGKAASGFALDVLSTTNDENLASFLPLNGSQGVAIGFSGISKVGSLLNSDMKISPKGIGKINLDGPVMIKSLSVGVVNEAVVVVDNNNNLKKIASGLVGRTGANGLNSNVGPIELGGNLTKRTVIATTAANPIAFTGLQTSTTSATDAVMVVGADGTIKKAANGVAGAYVLTLIPAGGSTSVTLDKSSTFSNFIIAMNNSCVRRAISTFSSYGNTMVFTGGIGHSTPYTATMTGNINDANEWMLTTSALTCADGGGTNQFNFTIKKVGNVLTITNNGNIAKSYQIRHIPL